MHLQFVGGNRLTLLRNGAEYFPALIAAIEAARFEVYLETYIFEDDETGRAVAGALARAARRDVAVHLLVDGFGARDFPARFGAQMTIAGVQALVYRPEVARFRLARHRLRRLHRKIAVIDAAVAFVGGINVIDDHNSTVRDAPRYDYAVRVEGPLLAPIHGAARRLWEIVAWASFRQRFRVRRHPEPACAPAGGQVAAFAARDNIRHRRDIEDAYLAAIGEARDEIVIANAYFLPGLRFRHALIEAARRGVRVVVLLQGRTDHPLLHYATQALYGYLLAAGIRIFEYQKSHLHAKVAVIDRRWATVGSSNIDPFSLLLAREGNVVARDAAFAGELRDSLGTAMADGARELQARRWRQLGWWARLTHWTSYGLVRLMVGLAGYGRQHWGKES